MPGVCEDRAVHCAAPLAADHMVRACCERFPKVPARRWSNETERPAVSSVGFFFFVTVLPCNRFGCLCLTCFSSSFKTSSKKGCEIRRCLNRGTATHLGFSEQGAAPRAGYHRVTSKCLLLSWLLNNQVHCVWEGVVRVRKAI